MLNFGEADADFKESPKTSKPGPKLAVEAGTRIFFIVASLLNGSVDYQMLFIMQFAKQINRWLKTFACVRS